MDAGIGEAMLLSAAMGGGSAAITGGDPLKGAMLGALTGGVGYGLMPGATAAADILPGAGASLGNTASLGNMAASASQFVPPVGGYPTGIEASLADNVGKGLSVSGGGIGFNPQLAASGIQATGGTYALGAPSAASGYALGAPSVAPGSISGLSSAVTNAPTTPSLFNDPMGYIKGHQFMAGSAALAGATGARQTPNFPGEDLNNPLRKFRYDPSTFMPSRPYAEGGIASLGSNAMVVGGQPSLENNSSPVNMASGGISNLGSYSDGGRMLKGPGDGMSDSIPASIAGKRPARLAQGEFVVPADVVSHLGNGSTDAGANQLYHMMDKVRQARTGRKSQGHEINPGRYMPA